MNINKTNRLSLAAIETNMINGKAQLNLTNGSWATVYYNPDFFKKSVTNLWTILAPNYEKDGVDIIDMIRDFNSKSNI